VSSPAIRLIARRRSSLFEAIFDDAAIFPPGNAAMPDAVRTHMKHLRSEHGDWVGPFVCSADRLVELDEVLTNGPGASLDVTLTVPGGPPELDAAVADARHCEHVHLVGIELPQRGFKPAHIAATTHGLTHPLPVYVEVPVRDVGVDLAAELARNALRLKLRTGGTTASAFPAERVLADALAASVAAGLAFKCTAGLHNAVRHRDPETGFEHHGFLNIAVAVRELIGGAHMNVVRVALAETDGRRVAAAISELTPRQTTQVRSLFQSFGTCSVDDPLAALRAMGLVGPR
jgi:hypothetical protein